MRNALLTVVAFAVSVFATTPALAQYTPPAADVMLLVAVVFATFRWLRGSAGGN